MDKEQFFREGDLVGDYSVIRLLGKGASAEVYLVKHQLLDQLKAMKVIVSDKLFADTVQHERFLREIRIAASIQHPNLVSVSYVSQYQELGLSYIIMDYVDGDSLQNHLEKNNFHVPTDFALNVVESAAKALDAISRHGVVHRDIKPANIMLAKNGEIKLADLGIAKVTQDSEFASQGGVEMTMENTIIGTPVYASPEQNQDASKVDVRSDIYSLGMCLYLMAAGKLPFKSSALTGVIGEILYGELPEPRSFVPDLPIPLNRFIMRMIAREPSNRPQTPGKLLEEIADLRRELAGKQPEKKTSLKLVHPSGLHAPTLKNIQVPSSRGPALKAPSVQRPVQADDSVSPLPQQAPSPVQHPAASSGNPTLPVSAAEKSAPDTAKVEIVISEVDQNANIPFSWDQIPLLITALFKRLFDFTGRCFSELGMTILACGLIAGVIVFNGTYLAEFAKKIHSEKQKHATFREIRELKQAKTFQKKHALQLTLAKDGHWESLCSLIGDNQIGGCIQDLVKQEDPDCILTAATLLMLRADGKEHKEAEILKMMEKSAETGSQEAAHFLRTWYEVSGDKENAEKFEKLSGTLKQEEKQIKLQGTSAGGGEVAVLKMAKQVLATTQGNEKKTENHAEAKEKAIPVKLTVLGKNEHEIEPFALFMEKKGRENAVLEEYLAAWTRETEDLKLGQNVKKERKIRVSLFLQFIRRQSVYCTSPYRTYALRKKILLSLKKPFDKQKKSALYASAAGRLFQPLLPGRSRRQEFKIGSKTVSGYFRSAYSRNGKKYVQIGAYTCELNEIPEEHRWKYDKGLLQKRRAEYVRDMLEDEEKRYLDEYRKKVDARLKDEFQSLQEDPLFAGMDAREKDNAETLSGKPQVKTIQ